MKLCPADLRDLKILLLYSKGRDAKRIARDLNITEDAVLRVLRADAKAFPDEPLWPTS